jgi:glyoxylase-like metal-dependent hydrolase (beta-lactamase superfamily II)
MSNPGVIVTRRMLGPVSTNCWLIACAETGSVLVVDPGGPPGPVMEFLRKADAPPEAVVVNTHGHFDHVWGNRELGLPSMIHRLDAGLMASARDSGDCWGYRVPPPPPPSVLLEDGDTVRLGGMEFSVIHTPGHTPGSICLEGHGLLISGDTLFRGSVGRTDLPGGSHGQLMLSLRRLMPLDDGLRVLPGHDDETVLGFEKRNNPFLDGI